jgi:DNA-binding NarL/FixJ family response regulator
VRSAGSATAANIRVLLCHDHAVLRAGLERLFGGADGIDVVATAAEGGEGVAATVRLRPDVVLMDLAMPRIDTVLATRRIADLAPPIRVLILTGFPHPGRVRDAMRAGAFGVVLKDAPPAELLSAVRTAARGGGSPAAG